MRLALLLLLAVLSSASVQAQSDPIVVEPIPLEPRGSVEAVDEAAEEDARMLPGQVAVLQTLDKISTRISTLQIPVGQSATWERLEIAVAHCRLNSPFERPEKAALLRITEQRRGLVPIEVFSGWMFASSPGLHAMEHAIYDVVVVDCLGKAEQGGADAQ